MCKRSARSVHRPNLRATLLLSLCVAGLVLQGVLPVVGLGSEDRRTAVVKAVEESRNSVVNIHGQKILTADEDPLIHGDGPHKVNGMGTGIVIDERGYILTNFHVVDGVKKLEVTLVDGSSCPAQLISTDPVNDLAIVKVDLPKKLPVISIGTSSDLMVGESVIAMGNAFGYENTVTRGIVSAIHRNVQVSDTQSYDDLIQTDASINPGNSGGPLLNIDGDMIGVNVAVRAGAQGIGFAIPVDTAMSVAAKLMSVEKVERKWFGVKTSDTPEHPNGAVVASIEDDSPAAKCGLKAGDVITAVGDQTVGRGLDFERDLLGHDVGSPVSITVRRNNQTEKMSLAMVDLPQKESADPTWDLLGLKLQPITAAQFQQLQSRYHGGLSVVAVRPDSPASKQGIRRGDVLVGMHIWETTKLSEVEYVLNRPDFADFQPIKFYILRGNETLYGHLPVSLQRR